VLPGDQYSTVANHDLNTTVALHCWRPFLEVFRSSRLKACICLDWFDSSIFLVQGAEGPIYLEPTVAMHIC
jgi:hypothetical protein